MGSWYSIGLVLGLAVGGGVIAAGALARSTAGIMVGAVAAAAVGIADHRNDRVGDEQNLDTSLGELAQHGIDQERHVIVDDLQHQDRPQMLACGGKRLEPDLRRARLALGQEPPGRLRQRRHLAGVVANHVLRDGQAEERLREGLGRTSSLGLKHRPGFGHQERRDLFFLPAGMLLNSHG